MPAQFFLVTDNKPTGTDAAFRGLTRFMTQNNFALSPAIISEADIKAAIGEIWDALGGDIPTLRGHVTGALNTDASDVEIAILTMLCLQQKFSQYLATLPGAGP